MDILASPNGEEEGNLGLCGTCAYAKWVGEEWCKNKASGKDCCVPAPALFNTLKLPHKLIKEVDGKFENLVVNRREMDNLLLTESSRAQLAKLLTLGTFFENPSSRFRKAMILWKQIGPGQGSHHQSNVGCLWTKCVCLKNDPVIESFLKMFWVCECLLGQIRYACHALITMQTRPVAIAFDQKKLIRFIQAVPTSNIVGTLLSQKILSTF